MPVITELPQIEEAFRRTFVTEKCESMDTVTTRSRSRFNCYTISGPDFSQNFRDDYSLVTGEDPLSPLGKQASILALATNLFAGSKPLAGKEMEVLNKTFSRLRSSVPIKL